MNKEDLLIYKKNIFSQAGEDGILEYLFTTIGTTSKTCCEFGAWDGIYLSNTRNLILNGWKGLLIEGDPERCEELKRNYLANPLVICENTFVDTKVNTLDSLLQKHHIQDLDLLSIDIDGLDLEILKSLEFKPRIICIEANMGFSPEFVDEIDPEIAKKNVGNSLGTFAKIAAQKGYQLVCYTGNAIFVRDDLLNKHHLPALTPTEAYENGLKSLSDSDRKYLYLLNVGLGDSDYTYHNPYLSRKNLQIPRLQAFFLIFDKQFQRSLSLLKRKILSH